MNLDHQVCSQTIGPAAHNTPFLDDREEMVLRIVKNRHIVEWIRIQHK